MQELYKASLHPHDSSIVSIASAAGVPPTTGCTAALIDGGLVASAVAAAAAS